ncbi:hypothetical protein M514_01631 [Trichuris suis]|uniref:Uncharacterized protein n=1 Tax=Trichuris suis TaxID=68888 RepID=A0A085N267_9BILA|nr:hypothetical protein M514_01631 [Trichuris suis]
MASMLLLFVVASLCAAGEAAYSIRTYSMNDVREFYMMIQCIEASCSNALEEYICGRSRLGTTLGTSSLFYNRISSNRQEILQCLLKCDQPVGLLMGLSNVTGNPFTSTVYSVCGVGACEMRRTISVEMVDADMDYCK